METRTQILARIGEYLRRTETSERQFGISAVGDHKFLSRLRSGAGITLSTIERAEQFMRDHPPADEPKPAEDAA